MNSEEKSMGNSVKPDTKGTIPTCCLKEKWNVKMDIGRCFQNAEMKRAMWKKEKERAIIREEYKVL